MHVSDKGGAQEEATAESPMGRGRGPPDGHRQERRGYKEAGVRVLVLGLTSRMLVDKGILSTRLNLQISYLAGLAL